MQSMPKQTAKEKEAVRLFLKTRRLLPVILVAVLVVA
jgi:hypothetical protein